MPPLPPTPGVLQVACSCLINNVAPALTRFYISYAGTAPTNAQLGTFNGAVEATWATNITPLQDANTKLVQIETIDLTSATAAQATNAYSVAGTRAGSTLAAEIAMVISYEIGRRYRGGHPRGYWRMGTATDLGSGLAWVNTFPPAVQTATNSFFTAVLAAGWTGAGTLLHVNVSYFKGFTVVTSPTTGRARNVPTLRAAPVVDTVTSIIARSSYGTQRRRVEFVD